MQIMVLNKTGQIRTYQFSRVQLISALAGLLIATLLLAYLLQWLTLRFVPNLPGVDVLISQAVTKRVTESEQQQQQGMEAMAIRLGELQAQMVKLHNLGNRVQRLANIKPSDFDLDTASGKGGPIELTGPWQPAQLDDMLKQLGNEMLSMEDFYGIAESNLSALKNQISGLGGTKPVNIGQMSSGFGVRTDPFTGRSAFHRGLDFSAPTGTPIYASAAGRVIQVRKHAEYGNVLDIAHDGGVVTRYAHTHRILVREGDRVQQGDHIADVGSSGRSTGPHLHFEVYVNNVVQNPRSYLELGTQKNIARQ